MNKLVKIVFSFLLTLVVVCLILGRKASAQTEASENKGQTDLTFDDYFQALSNGATPDFNDPDQVKLLQFYLMNKFALPSEIYNWDQSMLTLKEALARYPKLFKIQFPRFSVTISLDQYEKNPKVAKVFERSRELYSKIFDPSSEYWRRLGSGASKSNSSRVKIWSGIYRQFNSDIGEASFSEIDRWAQEIANGGSGSSKVPNAWLKISSWAKKAKDSDASGAILKSLALSVKSAGAELISDPGLRDAILYDMALVSGFSSPQLCDTYRNADGKGQIEKINYMLFDESKEFRQELNLGAVPFNEKASINLNDLAALLKDSEKGLKKIQTKLKQFMVRSLSLVESPFRSALGADCSSNNYFEKAMDPNFYYFTTTYADGSSTGHLTIVLGTARGELGTARGEKVAMLDKVQNIPTEELPAILETARRSLLTKGYLLGIPEDLGDHNGLSNDFGIRDFVQKKLGAYTGSSETLRGFRPHSNRYEFANMYSRAYLNLPIRILNKYPIEPNSATISIEEVPIPKPASLEGAKISSLLENTYQMRKGSDQDKVRYIQTMRDFEASGLLSSYVEPNASAYIKEMYKNGSQKIRKEVIGYFLPKQNYQVHIELFNMAKQDFINSIQNYLQTPRFQDRAIQVVYNIRQLLIDNFLSENKTDRGLLKQILKANKDSLKRSEYYKMVQSLFWDTDFIDREIDQERLRNLVDFANLGEFVTGPLTPLEVAKAAALAPENGEKTPDVFISGTVVSKTAPSKTLELAELSNNRRLVHWYMFGREALPRLVSIARTLFNEDFESGSVFVNFFESQKSLWPEDLRAEFYAKMLFGTHFNPDNMIDFIAPKFFSFDLQTRIKSVQLCLKESGGDIAERIAFVLLGYRTNEIEENRTFLRAISNHFDNDPYGFTKFTLLLSGLKFGDETAEKRLREIASNGLIGEEERKKIEAGDYVTLGFESRDHRLTSLEYPNFENTYKIGEIPRFAESIDAYDKSVLENYLQSNSQGASNLFTQMKNYEKGIYAQLVEAIKKDGHLKMFEVRAIFGKAREDFLLQNPPDRGVLASPLPMMLKKLGEAFKNHLKNAENGLVLSNYAHRLGALVYLLRAASQATGDRKLELARFIGEEAAKLRYEGIYPVGSVYYVSPTVPHDLFQGNGFAQLEIWARDIDEYKQYLDDGFEYKSKSDTSGYSRSRKIFDLDPDVLREAEKAYNEHVTSFWNEMKRLEAEQNRKEVADRVLSKMSVVGKQVMQEASEQGKTVVVKRSATAEDGKKETDGVLSKRVLVGKEVIQEARKKDTPVVVERLEDVLNSQGKPKVKAQSEPYTKPTVQLAESMKIRGAQYANSLIFLVSLQIIDCLKANVGNREHIDPGELAMKIAGCTTTILNSPEIAAGMVGSKALEYVPGKITRVSDLSGIRAQIATQVLSVVTYVGWTVGAQLYADAMRGMKVRPTLLQIIKDRDLADEVFSRIKVQITSGRYKESFETAIYKGVLTGDSLFFIGFMAVGAEIGTVMFPGVGTAMGILLGGTVSIISAIAAKMIPKDVTEPITDILTNYEKWVGESQSDMLKDAIKKLEKEEKWENLSKAVNVEGEGRGHIADSLFGIYLRNLEFWHMREQVLMSLKKEQTYFNAHSFAEYNYNYPGRQFREVQSNLRDPMGFENLINLPQMRLNEGETRGSIANDIEKMSNLAATNKRKVVEAFEHLGAVYTAECAYYTGLMTKPNPILEEESDKVCRINMKLDEIFDPTKLESEIQNSASDKTNLNRVFGILSETAPYKYDERIFLKQMDPSWIDTSNIQYWDSAD